MPASAGLTVYPDDIIRLEFIGRLAIANPGDHDSGGV